MQQTQLIHDSLHPFHELFVGDGAVSDTEHS